MSELASLLEPSLLADPSNQHLLTSKYCWRFLHRRGILRTDLFCQTEGASGLERLEWGSAGARSRPALCPGAVLQAELAWSRMMGSDRVHGDVDEVDVVCGPEATLVRLDAHSVVRVVHDRVAHCHVTHASRCLLTAQAADAAEQSTPTRSEAGLGAQPYGSTWRTTQ